MSKILLVEDKDHLLILYHACLEKPGRRIVVARDGLETVLKLRNEKFDFIVTEFEPPKLAGPRLIDMLLDLSDTDSDSDSQNTHVIVLTDDASDANLALFVSQPRIHILERPFDMSALRGKVEELNAKTKKRGLDVTMMNAIIKASTNEFSRIMGSTCQIGKPYRKLKDEKSGEISSFAGVMNSHFRGIISLSFSKKSYLKLISELLKVEQDVITEKNNNTAAKILEGILANACDQLRKNGANFQFSAVGIVRGDDHKIENISELPVINIPFNTKYGDWIMAVHYQAVSEGLN